MQILNFIKFRRFSKTGKTYGPDPMKHSHISRKKHDHEKKIKV